MDVRIMVRSAFFALVLVLSIGHPALAADGKAYTFTPDDLLSVGHILDIEQTGRFGYGFVLGPDRHVITCWHVATADIRAAGIAETLQVHPSIIGISASDTLLFRRLWDPRIDTIVLISEHPVHDIAVYKPLGDSLTSSLKAGDYTAVAAGDSVSFLEWKDFKTVSIVQRPVELKAATHQWSTFTEYLVIRRGGGPGSSGSPVVTSAGEVVAVISVGKPVVTQSGKTVNEFIAVSLKPILEIRPDTSGQMSR